MRHSTAFLFGSLFVTFLFHLLLIQANEGFSSSDEISYERNGDMPWDAETMVVAFSPQTCEVAIITECNAGASSNI